MAKQIIALELSEGNPITVTVLFWYPVATLRQPYYALAGATSAWAGASAPENAAIAAGQVHEVAEQVPVPKQGTPALTLAAIEAELVSRYAIRAAAFAALDGPSRYGSFYDPGAGGWTRVSI